MLGRCNATGRHGTFAALGNVTRRIPASRATSTHSFSATSAACRRQAAGTTRHILTSSRLRPAHWLSKLSRHSFGREPHGLIHGLIRSALASGGVSYRGAHCGATALRAARFSPAFTAAGRVITSVFALRPPVAGCQSLLAIMQVVHLSRPRRERVTPQGLPLRSASTPASPGRQSPARRASLTTTSDKSPSRASSAALAAREPPVVSSRAVAIQRRPRPHRSLRQLQLSERTPRRVTRDHNNSGACRTWCAIQRHLSSARHRWRTATSPPSARQHKSRRAALQRRTHPSAAPHGQRAAGSTY